MSSSPRTAASGATSSFSRRSIELALVYDDYAAKAGASRGRAAEPGGRRPEAQGTISTVRYLHTLPAARVADADRRRWHANTRSARLDGEPSYTIRPNLGVGTFC